jgi:hypothetical protein
LPKITILRWCFPSKCCNFSMDWDTVKCFSALVTRYIMIDLGSFLASHKSKIFLAISSNPPNRRGHIPFLAYPWCIFWLGGRTEKVLTFLNNIFQTITSVGVLNKAFFHHLRHQMGGGGLKRRLYRVMG